MNETPANGGGFVIQNSIQIKPNSVFKNLINNHI